MALPCLGVVVTYSQALGRDRTHRYHVWPESLGSSPSDTPSAGLSMPLSADSPAIQGHTFCTSLGTVHLGAWQQKVLV